MVFFVRSGLWRHFLKRANGQKRRAAIAKAGR
jgi:hypothetical protein